ncbi:BT_3987 domain-containing protein [uncultured Bacteroides sp.]|uniref:BT_3987 domain-containing protein n=1 Tax=uncultured Bacteroides sp. TaxID=162156 RepID=UPI002AAC019A|nr:DUF1735 domain-containing protein [uncultured Bacteroides sp.]
MNISLNFRCIIACLATFVALSLQSCSDKETYDVMGNPINKVYINTRDWGPINTPKNSFSFSIVHTPIGDFGDILAKFPIRSTREVSKSITVKAELDNSLVEVYNKTYGTKYVALPDGVLDLSKATSTIERGQSLSSDSITVSADPSKRALLTEKFYLAPIKLSSVSESDCEISSEYNTAYVLITTSTSLIKTNVGSSEMLGSLVTNCSTWTVTSDITPSAGTYSNIFDGSKTTNWRFPSTPVILVIDMKESKKVSGLRLFAQYAQYGYIFNQVNISLSKDNVTYNEIGTSKDNDMTNESGYQYISFYGSVEAQYIKLTLNWKYNYYPWICELGIYAN